MRHWKLLALPVLTAGLITATRPAPAQVSVSIGPEPSCPYGFYDVAPYNCAPYGYYGPEWFNGGVFIGAGPWFHGPQGFHGHVNNHYDPSHGYKGPTPNRGEAPKQQIDANHFKGNEMRDGQGHAGGGEHK